MTTPDGIVQRALDAFLGDGGWLRWSEDDVLTKIEQRANGTLKKDLVPDLWDELSNAIDIAKGPDKLYLLAAKALLQAVEAAEANDLLLADTRADQVDERIKRFLNYGHKQGKPDA